MTKQDFELIAGVVAHVRAHAPGAYPDKDVHKRACEAIARGLAAVLTTRGARFRADLFLRACGVVAPDPGQR